MGVALWPLSLSDVKLKGQMSAVVSGSERIVARRPSLKEQPSYLKEVSVALTRREELLRLRERMSAAKLIMEADPSAKPWLLSRSISNNSIPRCRKVSKDSRSSRDT